jgi:hypothetical protein
MRWRKILLVLLFIIAPVLAFADPGEACEGEDPFDNACPLDSWVYMLVVAPAAITLVGVFLRSQAIKEYQKEKEQATFSEPPEEKHKNAA